MQVSVAEWLVRLTAVWEDPASNHTTGSCVYRDSCCDIQSWARAVHLYCTFTLTQPSTLRGTVKWVSAYGLSNNNNGDGDVDDSCQFSADSKPKSPGLVWGLAATRRSIYIHQMNRVNFRNDDSTVNIVVVIIIMVATAVYSVTMVLLKETAFPLCRAMERCWKRNVVSRVDELIQVNLQ